MKTESKLPVPRFKIKLPEKIPINNDITTFFKTQYQNRLKILQFVLMGAIILIC